MQISNNAEAIPSSFQASHPDKRGIDYIFYLYKNTKSSPITYHNGKKTTVQFRRKNILFAIIERRHSLVWHIH